MVVKRGGYWYLRIRPFGNREIGVKTSAQSKTEIKQIEVEILAACRAGDYSRLSPPARETCIRIFDNQNWEVPGDLRSPGRAPVQELSLWRACELFFKYPGISNSPGRWRYEFAVVHLVEKLSKNRPLKELWVPELKVYQVERQAEGAAPATINRELSTLSRIFTVMIEMQLIQDNPVRRIKSLSTRSGERHAYLSAVDIQRIVDLSPAWMRPIVLTGYYSGMRRGEILGLERRQVDLSKRMITLYAEDTKEGICKRVPLHPDLVRVLREVTKISSLESTRFFLVDGRPPSKHSVSHAWKQAATRARIDPRPCFHDLRHTWKTNARRSGMDSEIRESILGHSTRSLSVSERYGWISDEELLAVIDSMTFDHGDTTIIAQSVRKGGRR